MLRHGDVILIEIEDPIDGREEKECILALGEQTGHSHRIEEGAVKIQFDTIKHKNIHLSVYQKIKQEFEREFPGETFPFNQEDIEIGCLVRVEKECRLIHEEHHALVLPEKTNHAVIIQRNYTPSGWRKVLD